MKRDWMQFFEQRGEPVERVAILGEDDRGFVGAAQQTPQCAHLRLRRLCANREGANDRQAPTFVAAIVETGCSQLGAGLLVA